MPPALMLIGIGVRPRFPIPIPLLLLWPLLAFSWLVLRTLEFAARSARPRGWTLGRRGIEAFCRLSGSAIDVDSASGGGFHIRLL